MKRAARGTALAAVAWLACAWLLPASPARCQEPPQAPAASIEELWAGGEAAFEAGDLAAALRLFTEALGRDERRARSWNYLGGVHFAQGDLVRALQDFLRAVELDPLDVRAGNNLGTTLERLGEPARAEEAYLRAARSDPSYPLTQRNLGILQARLGNPEGARRSWQRYLELAPAGAYAEEIRRALAALDAPDPAPAKLAPSPAR